MPNDTFSNDPAGRTAATPAGSIAGRPIGRVETRIPNRIEVMPSVVAMVETFGAEHGVPRIVVNDLNLALDEALNNIISHAYAPGAEGEIAVRILLRSGEIVAEIEDAGKPFDPLAAPAPDFSVPVRGRKPGGLGIYFMKSLMDHVAYVRRDGMNRLRLCKRFTAA
jgi:serine/threonine-protein kinase RsbW